MKKLLILLIFWGNLALFSQSGNNALKVYTFSEIEKLQLKSPKPILIFTYTDWCKICYGMKKKTFKNNEVINLLNNNFYFVKLNGEEKKDITFLNKKFVYKPSGNKTGIHQLALELAAKKGKISYPTTTILNDTFHIDAQIDNYMNSKKFYKLLESYLK